MRPIKRHRPVASKTGRPATTPPSGVLRIHVLYQPHMESKLSTMRSMEDNESATNSAVHNWREYKHFSAIPVGGALPRWGNIEVHYGNKLGSFVVRCSPIRKHCSQLDVYLILWAEHGGPMKLETSIQRHPFKPKHGYRGRGTDAKLTGDMKPNTVLRCHCACMHTYFNILGCRIQNFTT